MIKIALMLVFLAILSVEAIAQTVEARGGNIFFIAKDGEQRQITSSGLDLSPSLDFSENRIVFVRQTPDLKLHVPICEVPDCTTIDNEIWIADAGGVSPPHRVLRAPRVGSFGRSLIAGFRLPQLSLDGSLIFFRTEAGADAFAFYSLHLASGFVRLLFYGVEYSTIRTGKYQGYLIASVFLPGARTHVPVNWLVNPQGRLHSEIGGDYTLSQFKKQNGIR